MAGCPSRGAPKGETWRIGCAGTGCMRIPARRGGSGPRFRGGRLGGPLLRRVHPGRSGADLRGVRQCGRTGYSRDSIEDAVALRAGGNGHLDTPSTPTRSDPVDPSVVWLGRIRGSVVRGAVGHRAQRRVPSAGGSGRRSAVKIGSIRISGYSISSGTVRIRREIRGVGRVQSVERGGVSPPRGVCTSSGRRPDRGRAARPGRGRG